MSYAYDSASVELAPLDLPRSLVSIPTQTPSRAYARVSLNPFAYAPGTIYLGEQNFGIPISPETYRRTLLDLVGQVASQSATYGFGNLVIDLTYPETYAVLRSLES